MTKKRRMFDIDLPDDEVETFPVGKPQSEPRRGPMATAIAENADSLRERDAVAQAIRAENDALAHEHVRLKQAGLITDLVPLDLIETYKLARDRFNSDDMEMAELVASIRDIGLSNPIRVEPRADGRYELVQGFRRLTAYKTLLAETGDVEKYGSIPAGLIARGDALETLYRRMVDENLVRKDISFAEMAQLAIRYAGDPEIAEVDPDRAVAILFQSAGYQKRSYIRGFIKLMSRLGDTLVHAPAIPRALGLALSARLEEVPGLSNAIKAELKDWDNRSVNDELDVLRRFAGGAEAELEARPNQTKPKPAVAGPAKTSFQIIRPQGAAKCVAGAGRLEIRLDRDFSAVDRHRLEQAVRMMLDQIE